METRLNYTVNHIYNNILKFDWLSATMISASIGGSYVRLEYQLLLFFFAYSNI